MSDDNTGIFSCRNTCWIIGALLGLALFLLLLGKGVFLALIVGLVILVVSALVLQAMFCKDAGASASAEAPIDTPASAPAPTSSTASQAEAEQAAAEAATAAAEAEAAVTEAEAAAEAAEKAAAEKAAAEQAATEAAEAEAAAERAAAEKAAIQAAEAEAAAAQKAAAEAEAAAAEQAVAEAAEAAPASAAEVSAEDVDNATPAKPRTMKAPRKAGADDLKQLKGVGPKLEQTLNDLGFWHFDQIAKWGAAEIAWVDSNLRFKGRIVRDGWVDQAKALAKGGDGN